MPPVDGVFDNPSDGVPADSAAALVRPDDLLAAVVRFLVRVHRSEPAPDAVPLTPSSAVERARRRLDEGLIDNATFDPPYRPQDPARLVDIASGMADTLVEVPPVAVHGSLALADLRLDGGEVVGWSVPAVPRDGDPYVDLAWLARDLSIAISPGAVPALFDSYGLDRPEPMRIEFWVTIHQLLS